MENKHVSLDGFGNRELLMTADLLTAYVSATWASREDTLCDEAAIEFNPNSGTVFLVDENCSVAMVNGEGKLENWLYCGECGAEGLRSEMSFSNDGLCSECATEQ